MVVFWLMHAHLSPFVLVPSAPGEPSVAPISLTEASVEWPASTATPTKPVEGYNVSVREKGKKAWKKVTKKAIRATEHTLTDLIPGQEYEVQISAVNDLGESVSVSKSFLQPEEALIKGRGAGWSPFRLQRWFTVRFVTSLNSLPSSRFALQRSA